jgi:hypothetical protein
MIHPVPGRVTSPASEPLVDAASTTPARQSTMSATPRGDNRSYNGVVTTVGDPGLPAGKRTDSSVQ